MQNIDMRVHDAGFSSSGSIGAHSHEGTGLHEFHYFLKGEGQFWNGSTPAPVRPGSIFLSSPETCHRAEAPGRLQFYYLLFTIDHDSDGLFDRVRQRFATGRPLSIGRTHAATFEDIRQRLSSPESLIRRSADFRFLAFLCDLAGNRTSATARQATRYVDEALALMQASLHQPLDLDEVAKKLGINKSYFVRLFKQTVGVPPMRYFLGLRLDSAKHRLRNGDERLRAIAVDLGFHDEFHFSHQFKTHVGQSPQSYRQS